METVDSVGKEQMIKRIEELEKELKAQSDEIAYLRVQNQKSDEELEKLSQILDKTTQDHLSLIDACTFINSTLDLDKLKKLIMELAASGCGAESSSIMLIDYQSDEFFFDSIVGGKSDKVKEIRFPRNEGIAGWVAENREPVLIENVNTDERFYDKVDEKSSFTTRSILCVPLISKDRVIGVVEVLNKIQGTFTDSDMQYLMALANQAAITIENAMLYSDLSQEKRKIETIVNSMADGVIVTDEKYKITLMNPAAREIFMMNEKAAAQEKIRLLLDELKELGQDSVVDIVLMRPEKLILSNRTTIMKDSGSKVTGAILALRNITEMRKKERMKSEFLTVVSHRLSEPVEDLAALIELECQVLEEKTLEKLNVLVERIRKYVINLIFFSEIEAGPMRLGRKNMNMVKCFDESLKKVKTMGDFDGVSIEQKIPADFPNLRADQDRIEQLYENLLLYVFKLTDNKNPIVIDFQDSPENQQITLSYTGKSFPQEVLVGFSHRFDYVDSFMFGDDPFCDQGIGLAFIRHIVDAHGGEISITSDGSSSKISFTLIK